MGRPAATATGLLLASLILACDQAEPPGEPRARRALTMPFLHFVENRGQWDEPARFVTWMRGLTASFEPTAMRLHRGQDRRDSIGLVFEGTAADARVVGEDVLEGRYNFYVGRDPAAWREQVPAYGTLLYRGLYDGIDLRVREHDGHLEYDLALRPGADLEQVTIRAEGISRLEQADDGSLTLHTPAGALRQTPPTTWEILPSGERRPVECRVRIIDAQRYGFEAPGRDRQLALVVDPGLIWSTYLGGSSGDWIEHAVLAGDGSGDVILSGASSSTDFAPVAVPPGAQPIFILRLSAAGDAVRYATVIAPSTGTSQVKDLFADGGDVLFVGSTGDVDFPTTAGAYQRALAGGVDAVVGRLNPAGALTFSTFLGAGGLDVAEAVALAPGGAMVVAGFTESQNFPVTAGAYDTSFNTPPPGDNTAYPQDVFLSRLSPDGSQLTYSTYFGGQTYEFVTDMAVDAQGMVTLMGGTTSSATGRDLPVTANAFDPTWNGSEDIFLARFSLAGNGAADLRYSTFLGGINLEEGYGMAVDPGNPELVTLAGLTWVDMFTPPAFPTTPGVVKPALTPVFPPTPLFPHVRTGFLTRFRFPAVGSPTLVWSTYLGGNVSDFATDVAVDEAGTVIVVGKTESFDLPTTRGAFDRTYAGDDLFVWRLSPDARQLLYGSYLGGSRLDVERHEPAHVLALGGGAVIVAGITNSADFPTTSGAFDPLYAPGPPGFVPPQDGFVAKLHLEADASGDLAVGTPTLLSPPNGATFPVTGDVVLRWSDVPDASGIEAYNFQVSTNPAFPPNATAYRGSVSTPSVTLSSPALVQWFWRVQAADRAGNLGAWSPASTFTPGVAGAPPVLAALTLQPPRVNGGRTSSGSAHLNFGAVAPAGGALVTLASSNPALAAVPASVTIPAGANRASFPITTAPVAATTAVTISGERGLAASTPLTLEPPSVTLIASFVLTPASVPAGTPSTGTVTISNPAPAGGALVFLNSNNAAVALPSSVTIPAGASSVSFTINTFPVSVPTEVGLSAGHGTSLLAFLTVTPTTPPSPPAAPTLLSPANDARIPQPVTFDWSDVSGTAWYTIQIDDSSAFSTPLLLSQTVTPSQFTTGAIPGVSLRRWWRVRAHGPTGVAGAWSSTRLFRTTTGPVASTTTSTTPPTTSTSPPTTTTTLPPTTSTAPPSTTSTTTTLPPTTTLVTTTTVTTSTTVPADTVAIQIAEYDSAGRRLRVEATSSSSSATLAVSVTATGSAIGTLSNDGGGRYRGEFSVSTNPQNITVRSSRGGVATRAVTVK